MRDNDFNQMNLFNFNRPYKHIDKTVRIIELFSGIGAQAKALKILGVDFIHYKTCEWAAPSIKAYNAIHLKDWTDYSKDKTKEELIQFLDGNISTNYNEPCDVKKKPESWLRETYNNCIATHNLMNIMKVKGKDLEIVDTDKYEYIMTYSFPCQDLSLAGNKKGMSVSQADGGTRSGLLWEVERILGELTEKPQILIMENVPEVIGSRNIKDFQKWEAKLSSLGYTNFVDILNAKNYGIPQNRRRCFMISILGDYSYDFPQKRELKYRLKDLLEKEVDEKYYLSQKAIDGLTRQMDKAHKPNLIDPQKQEGETFPTLTAGYRKQGHYETYLKVKNDTKQGYLEAEEGDGVDISTRMEKHRGTVQKGLAQTLTCAGGANVGVVVRRKKNEKGKE